MRNVGLTPIFIPGQGWMGPVERTLGEVDPASGYQIWPEEQRPNEVGQVRHANNCLLLEGVDGFHEPVLIEAGIGRKFSPELQSLLGLGSEDVLPTSLAVVGYSTFDLKKILLTHFHGDHVGGLLGEDPQSHLVFRFPRARVLVSRAGFERAQHPLPPDRGKFRRDLTGQLTQLDMMERVEVIADDANQHPALGPAFYLHHSQGHTSGMLVPEMALVGGARLIFASDLIPTAAHLNLGRAMTNASGTGYDDDGRQVLREREKILTAAWKRAQGNLFVWFYHDPATLVARIERDEKTGRFVTTDAVPPPKTSTRMEEYFRQFTPTRFTSGLNRQRDAAFKQWHKTLGRAPTPAQRVRRLEVMGDILCDTLKNELDWPQNIDGIDIPDIHKFFTQYISAYLSVIEDLESALDYPKIWHRMNWHDFFKKQAHVARLLASHTRRVGLPQKDVDGLLAYVEFAALRFGLPDASQRRALTQDDLDDFSRAARHLRAAADYFTPRRKYDAQRFMGILVDAVMGSSQGKVSLFPDETTDYPDHCNPLRQSVRVQQDQRIEFHDARGDMRGWARIVAGGSEVAETISFDDGSYVSLALSRGRPFILRPSQDGVMVAQYMTSSGQLVKVLAWADGMGGTLRGDLGGSAYLQGVAAACARAAFDGTLLSAEDLFSEGSVALHEQVHRLKSIMGMVEEPGSIANAVGGVVVMVGDDATIASAGDALMLHLDMAHPGEVGGLVQGYTPVDMGHTFSSVTNSVLWDRPHLFNTRLENRHALVAGSDGMWENVYGIQYKWHLRNGGQPFYFTDPIDLLSAFADGSLNPREAAQILHEIGCQTNITPGVTMRVTESFFYDLPLTAAKDHVMAMCYVHEPARQTGQGLADADQTEAFRMAKGKSMPR